MSRWKADAPIEIRAIEENLSVPPIPFARAVREAILREALRRVAKTYEVKID